jgi:3'-5' exoribonuclease
MTTVHTHALGSRPFLKDAQPNARIEGAFCIANAQMGKTRADKPYLRCLLSDRTGEVAGRMWSIDEITFRRIPTDGFVWIDGETQPYQGELQLIIRSIEPLEPTGEQIRDLLPASKFDPAVMFAELTAILDTLTHPAAKTLAQAYLKDEYLMDLFRQAPAAKSMHHAFIGGLLEHTLQLLKLANGMLPAYPKLNRDIVLLGLFLHDLGKTRELIFDRGFGYSDRGELLGHVVDGAIMLHDKAQQAMRDAGQRFPANFVLILQHIIVSHHGQPEFGAAKIPATPEAIFVSQLDNLDAKTTMALASARPDTNRNADLGGNFTEKIWGLETKLFRADPLS